MGRGNSSWINFAHKNQEGEGNLGYVAPDQIEDGKFPFAGIDDVRPFRRILPCEAFCGQSTFHADWFPTEKTHEEEK